MKKTAVLLIIAMVFMLAGCRAGAGAGSGGADGQAGWQLNKVQNVPAWDFGLDVLEESFEEGEEASGNVLISPVSILSVLQAAGQGADGETLAQLEEAVGMSMEELSEYLSQGFAGADEGSEGAGDADGAGGTGMKSANAIWYNDTDSFTVNEDYLKALQEGNTEVYQDKFDKDTVLKINKWVEENTDGMIDKIVDQLSPQAVLMLINALAFEGNWAVPYEESAVIEDVFTNEDGTKSDAEFMHSQENVYLENEYCKGFMKYYEGNKFGYVAILPEEGMAMEDFLDELDGEMLAELLNEHAEASVNARMPKYQDEYSTNLVEALDELGIEDLFSPEDADLTKMGESSSSLYISDVYHKTFIEVSEKGTKAGAATGAVAVTGLSGSEDAKEVSLDRPFVYVIMDCESTSPLFMGVVKELA